MSLMIPPGLRTLVESLTVNGWSFELNHSTDGEGSYIDVDAQRGTGSLMITWHTRETGTYRLFTCMVNKRDVTLAKAMAAIA